MDQLTIFERLQKIIDAYEQVLTKRYSALEKDVAALIADYYARYGETITPFMQYNRLQSLRRDIEKLAAAHYSKIAQDLQQATGETSTATYLLYAYLLHVYFGNDGKKLLPLTSAVAKTSVIVAAILLLLKAARKPLAYFIDEHVDLLEVLEKHKADYVYGVFTDVKANLRGGAGYTEWRKRLQTRTKTTHGFGIRFLYELLNDVINYAQDKIYDVLKEHGGVEKMWVSMRDHKVRMAHRDLDSTYADEKGWFHHSGDKARRPKGFLLLQQLNYNCRCKLFLSFNGQLPRISRIYNYRDGAYLVKLDERIDELKARGKTHIQAVKQAQDEIKPPRGLLPYYITFAQWNEEYGLAT